jgi:hypothetical protein
VEILSRGWIGPAASASAAAATSAATAIVAIKQIEFKFVIF